MEKNKPPVKYESDIIDEDEPEYLDNYSGGGEKVSYRKLLDKQISKIMNALDFSDLENISKTINTLELTLYPYLKNNAEYRNKVKKLQADFKDMKSEKAKLIFYKIKYTLLIQAMSDNDFLPGHTMTDIIGEPKDE